jgi:diacylglycerol O-acyltransferase / wax synthase
VTFSVDRGPALIDRIPVADLIFLLEDQPTAPQTIGLLATFAEGSGGPSLDELRDVVAARLHAVPLLRRRAWTPGRLQGRPLWVDDEGFDLDDHLAARRVPDPGDDHAVLTVVADLLGTPLDRGRPLWELWLLEGAADGRTRLLWKLHHVLADGERALGLLAALVDPGPADLPEPWRPAPPPRALRLSTDAARRIVASTGAAVARLARPRILLARARDGVRQLRTDLRADAPRLPFNRPLSARRRYHVVPVGLRAVRDAAHDHGATVNDVVVAAVVAGVIHLLRDTGSPTAGLLLQASVPVSLRRHGAGTAAGNAVGGMRIPVPLDVDPTDTGALLTAVAAATRARKSGPRADAGFGLLGSELMPHGLLRAILGRALRGDQRFINTYVTDLVGPAAPVRLAGAEIVEAVPLAPLSAGVGLGAAALSYAGRLSITILADPEACPRSDLVAAGACGFLRDLTGGPSRPAAG